MIPLWLPVLLPVFAASLGYYLPRQTYRLVLFGVQLVQVAVVSALFLSVRADGEIRLVLGGWPGGVGIALVADRLSTAMVALTGWFFFALELFNLRKLFTDRQFQFLFVLLQGLLIGIFLSADLFNVYVLLELSTLVVSVLIMYKRDKETIYDGIAYIMFNLASMAFMLLGVGFVYRTAGSLDYGDIARVAAQATNPRALILPFAFVMTAVGVKSALFLLFAWLPRAHGAGSAPSSVSALLSGLQVKSGVYLLIRMRELFGPALDTDRFFLAVGVLTAVTGFVFAIAQQDIKLILAYHTVSQVGLIVVGLSLGTEAAWWGGVYHIINHAFFKALLFLSAGMIVHVYRTRNVYEIRGVFRRMPLVSIAAIAAILGITGAPYFNGSVSKYLIQSGWRGTPGELWVYLINLGTAVSFVKYAHIFFGSVPDAVPDEARQPDPYTTAVALAFGVVCLLGGVLARPIITLLFGVDVSVDGAYYLEKTIIYLVTIAVAFALYRGVIGRAVFIVRIRAIALPFNTLILGVIAFFAALVTYLTVVTA